jgi:ribosomal protein S2
MKLNNFLYSLGAHIGCSYIYSIGFFNKFIVGIRNNYVIFNLNYTLYLIKTANHFFYTLGLNQGIFLFYYHNNDSVYNHFKPYFHTLLENSNNCYFDEKWRYGFLSNMYMYFDLMYEDFFLYKYNVKFRKFFVGGKPKNILKFFFIMCSFTLKSQIPGMEWEEHLMRIRKYWRFFLFFKFYKYLNRLPDAFLYFTEVKHIGPLREANHLKIPTVSNLDANFNYINTVSYPIIGNSKSLYFHIFILLSFVKSQRKGTLSNYNKMLV